MGRIPGNEVRDSLIEKRELSDQNWKGLEEAEHGIGGEISKNKAKEGEWMAGEGSPGWPRATG